MALGILTLLMAVTVTCYTDMQADALHRAALSELDAIRTDIHRYQLERHTDYPLAVPPAGADAQDRRDPWFRPFRLDPARHLVYSMGPDGKDDRGAGDDVTMTYEAHAATELRPPQGLRVAEHGADWVELRWRAVTYKPGISGYNVFRRESVGSSDFTTVPCNAPALLPDSPEPKYRDEGLSAGKVYYYALEVVGQDGTHIIAPAPLGFQIPLTAPPRLSVTPAQVTVSPNQATQFTVVATGYGSPVRQVKFDGETFEVNAGSRTVVVSRAFGQTGTQKLLAEAFDADGRKAQVDVLVEVR